MIIHARIRMTNFYFTYTSLSNYIHISTRGQKDDVILNSFFFQALKCFVAQTIALIEKSFSHKRFVVTRHSKLDPILICFYDFFLSKVTMHVVLTYHGVYMKLPEVFQLSFFAWVENLP